MLVLTRFTQHEGRRRDSRVNIYDAKSGRLVGAVHVLESSTSRVRLGFDFNRDEFTIVRSEADHSTKQSKEGREEREEREDANG
jgi:hypothetical protein